MGGWKEQECEMGVNGTGNGEGTSHCPICFLGPGVPRPSLAVLGVLGLGFEALVVESIGGRQGKEGPEDQKTGGPKDPRTTNRLGQAQLNQSSNVSGLSHAF